MSKPHAWEEEEVDGGPIGSDDFWICKQCGCGGGIVNGWDMSNEPVKPYKREPTPSFSAGVTYGHVKVGDDCEEAQRIIAELKTRPDYQKDRMEQYKWYAFHAIKEMEKRYEAEGRLFKEGYGAGGFYVGIRDERSPGGITGFKKMVQAIPADIGWNDRGWTLRAPGPGQLATEKWVDNYNDMLREIGAFLRRGCSCKRKPNPKCELHCFPLGEGATIDRGSFPSE